MFKIMCTIGVLYLALPRAINRPHIPLDGKWKESSALVQCISSPRQYKIADVFQCDRYFICDSGIATPMLCEDGTVFDFLIQGCVLLNGADCNGRPLLQQPYNRNKCQRKTGLYPHEDPAKCHQYYQCLDGQPTLITCPRMLLFDRRRGVCDFADLADTSSCQLPPPPVICPSKNDTSLSELEIRLVPHPFDCQLFFLCESSTPRPLACEDHLAFDLQTLSCIKKTLVNRCFKEQEEHNIREADKFI